MTNEGRFDFGPTGRYAAMMGLAMTILSAASVLAVGPRVRPDLLAPVIVFLALELELVPGLVVASGMGYLAGVFSGEPRGLYWSATVVVFLLLRLFVFRVVGSRVSTVIGVVFLTTFLHLVVRSVVEAVFGAHRTPLFSMSAGFWSLVFGALFLGYPVYWLFRAVDERLKPKGDQFFKPS